MFSVAIELGGPRKLAHYRPLPITPGLRGFAGEESQLRAPRAGKKVSITGLATRFCPTGRDLFLERRVGADTGASWERHVLGRIVDKALLNLHIAGMELMDDEFERAVKNDSPVDIDGLEAAIRERGAEIVRAMLLEDWKYKGADATYQTMSIEEFANAASPSSGEQLIERTLAALNHLVEKEADCLARHLRKRRLLAPFLRLIGIDWMAEARATLSRLECERQLDNGNETSSFFGVSPNIVPDIMYAVTLVGDVKTGAYHSFYDSVAVSYVLVAESILKRRINTAAILSVDLDIDAGRVRSHKVNIVQPDDDKRRLWIAQRDLALNVINSDEAPRHPDDIDACRVCPYVRACWRDGKVGGIPITPEVRKETAPKKEKKGKA